MHGWRHLFRRQSMTIQKEVIMILDNSDWETFVDPLVQSSQRVLKAFREGRNPTFGQLDAMESAIEPFVVLKICGHRIMEECSCEAVV